MPSKWYDNHSELASFLTWLDREGGFSSDNLIEVVDAPWKWEQEHRLFELLCGDSDRELEVVCKCGEHIETSIIESLSGASELCPICDRRTETLAGVLEALEREKGTES